MFKAPTTVVVAYNRPALLHRLLTSVRIAQEASGNIGRVIVSVDGGVKETVDAARSFKSFGFEVVSHAKRMGLKDHVLWCGDVCNEEGAVVVLEDDLLLSPIAYHFVSAVLPMVRDDERVAALSLYALDFDECGRLPLNKSECVGDVFYARTSSSWGQVWWKEKWSHFREWLQNEYSPSKDYRVPNAVKRWSESSWKKLHNFYLSDTGQYSAFPRSSLALNLDAAGVHHAGLRATSFSFVRTLARFWDVHPRSGTLCLDEFLEFETDSIIDSIPDTNIALTTVEFDLSGQKRACDLRKEFVLTCRVQRISKAFREVSSDTGNPLLSLCVGVEGGGLWFGPSAEFREDGRVSRSATALRNYFAWLSDKELTQMTVRTLTERLKRKLRG